MGLKLGSLFDGIGGFPLAGTMCGIEPVWASEIEPFPVKVTAARFPEMKQLGDVTKINGAEVEPVDIITFGSPCQDLSVAGMQKGIHEGTRSSLFFEAIRIIKEMRQADENNGRTGKHIRPRWAVWENVPGAFSSHGGEDFKAVLEAIASVREDGVSVPRPPKGKWNNAGCVVGDGWSIAWRVYDAQYWGVPQRRKRIYLIADFATERAGEILFEREGMRGDSSESGTAWKDIAADAERSVGRGCAACIGIDGYNTTTTGNVSIPIRASKTDQDHVGCVCYPIEGNGSRPSHKGCGYSEENVSFTLNATEHHGIAYGLDRASYNQGANAKYDFSVEKELMATLVAKGPNAVCYDARGNGDGECASTITGDHENRITDYTTVVVESEDA